MAGRTSGTVLTVTVWLGTRALVVFLIGGRHSWVVGDLDYFSDALASVPDTGLGSVLVEYPLPGVLVVAVPWLIALALGSDELYVDVVLGLSLLADAAFTLLLARASHHRRRAALTVWLLGIPLLGATAYARFDLVPGLLAGTALLVFLRHPRLAGAAAALGTGMKLWPLLVVPALAARRSTRLHVLSAVGATGLVLVAASLAAAGWGRLLSPLTWQAERGLQIESVAATPAMVAWAARPGSHTITLTEHNAFEITGPGVAPLLTAAGVLAVTVPAILLVLWSRAFRASRGAGEPSVATVAWAGLGAVGLLMVTSKVLSPQYLLWLLPVAAAAVGVTSGRALRTWAALLLLTTGLTQLVFPELYVHLTAGGGHARWAVLALAVRNLLLVALTVWALVAAFRGVSGGGRSPASPAGRTGTST